MEFCHHSEKTQHFKHLGSNSNAAYLPVHPSICCIVPISSLGIYRVFSVCKIEIVCAPIFKYSGRLICSFLTPLFKEVVPGNLATLA